MLAHSHTYLPTSLSGDVQVPQAARPNPAYIPASHCTRQGGTPKEGCGRPPSPFLRCRQETAPEATLTLGLNCNLLATLSPPALCSWVCVCVLEINPGCCSQGPSLSHWLIQAGLAGGKRQGRSCVHLSRAGITKCVLPHLTFLGSPCSHRLIHLLSPSWVMPVLTFHQLAPSGPSLS